MGGGFYDKDTFSSLRDNYATKSTDNIFKNTKSNTIDSDMNPLNLKIRESRDSVDHPSSQAIIIALDETGSMGRIPEIIAREKLGKLMETLISNKVEDAHILFLGIGDHISDKYPIQVGQFEAETTLLDKWLTSINLESGGGGTRQESYLLAWLIAARHTSIDCFEKRHQKGFLFTIGDESNHPQIDAKYLKKLLNYSQSDDVTDVELLQEASRMYHVFHIHCEQGSYPSTSSTGTNILSYWKGMLGERVVILEDYNNICEVIATIVATISGAHLDDIIDTFDSKTAIMVKNTVSGVIPSIRNKTNEAVITFD